MTSGASSSSEEKSCAADSQDTDDVTDGAGGLVTHTVGEALMEAMERGGSAAVHQRRRPTARRVRGTGQLDGVHMRLEGSRRSARECRVRRKIRYQYVADMVTSRERAIISLRQELEMYKTFCMELDAGRVPRDLVSELQAGMD